LEPLSKILLSTLRKSKSPRAEAIVRLLTEDLGSIDNYRANDHGKTNQQKNQTKGNTKKKPKRRQEINERDPPTKPSRLPGRGGRALEPDRGRTFCSPPISFYNPLPVIKCFYSSLFSLSVSAGVQLFF
jgi:hypothetical protein